MFEELDDEWDDSEDAATVAVGDVLTAKGDRLIWNYDFGDDWEHQIVVEAIIEDGDDRAHCTGGKRAAPPEDCGGPWGYEELLAILADPNDEEHEERLEWAGGPIAPEAFNAGEIDQLLAIIELDGVAG